MPWWLPLAIVGGTVFALWLLFPKTYIEQTLRAQKHPNAATLAYLQLLVRAQPNDIPLRLALAHMALEIQDLPLARTALAPWKRRALDALPLAIAQARLRLLRLELLATPAHAPARTRMQKRYALALSQLAPRLAPPQLLQEARFAVQIGDYTAAAMLDRLALEKSDDPRLRSQAFEQGIAALLAAGKPAAALAFARAGLNHVPHDDALWRRMIGLALAANRADIAARYAHKLVGLPEMRQ